jgi:EAL domain-containing protein (putative c-di-GMP-specific phosphodiesterase class I)
VLARSIQDCVRWSASGLAWTVAVNVSARNLYGPAFADVVATMLDDAGLAPERLHLEVTETALGVEDAAAARTLTALAAHGVAVALDDFGVGYASLSHLRSLTLTEVKIDREFVRDLEHRESDREVVRSLVRLAHGLGLTVTAEGVESQQVASWLLDAGCDSAQGYYFAGPAPWRDLVHVVVPGVPRHRLQPTARTPTGQAQELRA